ncbi:MAG TPA: homocysteine S-methyltransferase [Actinomycetota bacterium]|nr:homocysteine S-methyltransferase [Actinomycetota bacterium]
MFADDVLVLDGGLATALEAAGADLSDELWSARLLLDDPSAIADVHRAYLDAGADVIITASYQASVDGFMRRGLSRDAAEELIRSSVTLARRVRDGWWGDGRAGRRRPLVAASVGPYGAVLADGSEYRGDYGLTVDELAAFHEPRLRLLIDREPDLLAIETIPSLDEARALAQALERAPAAPPAWWSFTCRDDEHLADGSAFGDAVDVAAAAPGTLAVGVNCTDPRLVARLVEAAASRTGLPVVVYPNRAARWDATAKRWGDDGVDDLAVMAPTWRDAGARLIGGCCGTLPRDIRAIAAAVGPAARP